MAIAVAIVMRIAIGGGPSTVVAVQLAVVPVAGAVAIRQQHGVTVADRRAAVAHGDGLLFGQQGGGFGLPFGRVAFDLWVCLGRGRVGYCE